MIIQTVNFSMFRDTFQAVRTDNFDYDGQRALFDYLEQYSEDIGAPVDLDIVSYCCEWQQMTRAEIKEQYNIPEDEEAIDWLNDRTSVIRVSDDSYLVHEF